MKAPAFFVLLAALALACRAPTGAALVADPVPITPVLVERAIVTPYPTPSPTIQPSPTPTPAPACVVSAWRLFVRRGPGRDTGALGVVATGDVLTILEPGAWLRVRTPAGVGYVSGEYCISAESEE